MVLLRLLGALLDVLVSPIRALMRARAVPEGAFVALTIDGPVEDVSPRPRFWEVREKRATSLYEVGKVVDAVIADTRVRGLLVTLNSLGTGMAGATSLRGQLARARAAGKEVVVHLPLGGGSKEVLVASAATKLLLGPAAQLAPVGFVVASRYFRSALDRAGVDVEVFACGEYKSAGEAFVRDSMSEPQREQLERLLDGFQAALVSAIADGRQVSEERARAIVDGGPYFGQEAVEAGLVDALAYEDDVAAMLGLAEDEPPAVTALTKTELRLPAKPRVRFASKKIVSAERFLAAATRPLVRRVRPRQVVAVVRVHGAIAHARSVLGQRVATDEAVIRAVRLARLDPRIVGVVLHVDSPGGSALASDRMHHEIAQLARQKPVVACMANVAASGGYYVSAPCHRVVCEATTITGSIGVVGARVSLDPLLGRLGVTTESVRRGARAGLLTAALPISDDERAAISRELDATYHAFLGVVARGRKMTESEVEALARGRVYTGSDALAAGLVDALGGFEAAMRELGAMLPAEVRERAEPVVVRAPRRPLPVLGPPEDGEAGRRAAASLFAALLPDTDRALVGLAASGERALLLWTEASALDHP